MNTDQIRQILDDHDRWLRGAGGPRANLSEANLSRANLSRACLSGADLSGANLCRANLSGANLSRADLSRANLSEAYLSGADLSRANLSGADLSRADLSGATLPGFQICYGELLVWKKARDDRLVHLKVPAEAKRTAALVGRKCRAEFAVVVAITSVAGETFQDAVSMHDCDVIYRVGETIRPDSYDDDIRVECTHGIHFFLTREEAEAY